jgi:hypothetical protein
MEQTARLALTGPYPVTTGCSGSTASLANVRCSVTMASLVTSVRCCPEP